MKKIISLGLACALAVSPLSCNCACASGDENISAQEVSVQLDTKFDSNKVSKKELAEELAKLEKELKKQKKENKKSSSLIKQLTKLGILITIFSVIVAEYYNFKCYNDYNIRTPFFRNIVEKFTDSTGLIVRGICPKILRPFRDYGQEVDGLLIRLFDFLENSIKSLKTLIKPEEQDNFENDL